jgi:single-stranded-DNA-specific exonuclease
MQELVEMVTAKLLEESSTKPLRIITHFDTDGITSAGILIKTFQRMDKKFTLRVVNALTREVLQEELQRQPREVLIFADVGTGSLEHFRNLSSPLFIFDHHEINSAPLPHNVFMLNPHLMGNLAVNNCTSAGASYLVSRCISANNKDLSTLAIVGMIGDRQEPTSSEVNKGILADCEHLTTKKGLIIYPATRPLRRTLEHSISPFIPGVTGNATGVVELLKETRIGGEKSLLDLSDDEMSRLITSIMVRRAKAKTVDDIIGSLYLLKFINAQEDAREISVLINACSRLGYTDIALSYCMGNEKAKMRALDLYNQYRQELVSGIKTIEAMNRIDGKGFVILNGKDKIKDAIVGTLCSMLSSSPTYEEGTILIGMAYNQDKIKVSARSVGRKGKNLREVLEKAVVAFRAEHPGCSVEMGGHEHAAGCLVERSKEQEFIEVLKKNLEVELIKI